MPASDFPLSVEISVDLIKRSNDQSLLHFGGTEAIAEKRIQGRRFMVPRNCTSHNKCHYTHINRIMCVSNGAAANKEISAVSLTTVRPTRADQLINCKLSDFIITAIFAKCQSTGNQTLWRFAVVKFYLHSCIAFNSRFE